jgi:hypothetical protein
MAIQFNNIDYDNDDDDPYLSNLIDELKDAKKYQNYLISIVEMIYQKRRNNVDYDKELNQLIYELIGRQ